MMAYKPILFNTEMVQAIMAGLKTQTRRLVKNQYGIHPRRNNIGWLGWDDGHGYRMKPPCEAGDILWVRETFDNVEAGHPWHYKADGDLRPKSWKGEHWMPSIHMPKEAARIFLRVKDVRVERLQEMSEDDCMAEGIREFTKDGKLFKYATQSGDMPTIPWQDMPVTPGRAFATLWDSTIKPADLDTYGWAANPWVWVIEFERCEKPEGWC